MTSGHNISSAVDGDHLRAFVQRVEAVEATIKEEQEARKEIYQEAKSAGFDPKTIRKLVAMRRQDVAKRQEEEEILNLYLAALGME